MRGITEALRREAMKSAQEWNASQAMLDVREKGPELAPQQTWQGRAADEFEMLRAALKAIVDQCDDRPRGCTKNSPVIINARKLLETSN